MQKYMQKLLNCIRRQRRQFYSHSKDKLNFLMKLISLFQFQHSIAHLRQIYQAKRRHHVLL